MRVWRGGGSFVNHVLLVALASEWAVFPFGYLTGACFFLATFLVLVEDFLVV